MTALTSATAFPHHDNGTAALAACGSAVKVLICEAATPLAEHAATLAAALTHSQPLLLLRLRDEASPQRGPGVVREDYLGEALSKAQLHADSIEALAELLPEALRIAGSGRRGPVLLELPASLLAAASTAALTAAISPSPAAGIEPEQLEEAARLLRFASRPLLVIGGGVVQAGAIAAALTLAEHADLPWLCTAAAQGELPCAHPLALGLTPPQADTVAARALRESDLLLVVGARLPRAVLAPRARCIHIDLDAREHGKFRAAELSIAADAEEALRALTGHLPRSNRLHWRRRLTELKLQAAASQAPTATPPRSALAQAA